MGRGKPEEWRLTTRNDKAFAFIQARCFRPGRDCAPPALAPPLARAGRMRTVANPRPRSRMRQLYPQGRGRRRPVPR